jgi:O-antigen/teichoic acid export membrane protein
MGFAYQVTNMLLSFVSRTIFIRTLGNEYLGLNGIFSDVLTLLSMADLGFSTAMSYSFYKPLADKDHDKIRELVTFYKKVYNVIAVAVLTLGLACIPFLKFIVNTEKENPYLVVYYLFSLTSVVVSYMFVYKTTLLTADQKDYKVVNIRMIVSVVRTLVRIAVLVIWHNYIIYLAIGTVSSICSNLISSKKAEKEYPYIKDLDVNSRVDPVVKKGIVDNMKSVFIYKVSTTLFKATDNIIISMVVSTAAVGLYSNYHMLSQKLLLIEQIIFSAMTASVGNVIAKEKPEKRYSVFESIQSISFILCGVIVATFCLICDDFVRVWLGPDYMLPRLVVVAVTINTMFSCILQPLWLYRDASGLYRKTKYIMLVATIENIILSVALGRILGIAGVIFASAIARITTYCWYEPKLLFREYFNRSCKKYYLQILLNVLLTVAVIALGKLVGDSYVPTGWFTLFLKAGVIGSFCIVVYVLAYYRTEGAQSLIRKAREIMSRRVKARA